MSERNSPTRTLEDQIAMLSMRLHDATTKAATLTTRVDVLEHFIKQRFPDAFAGETSPEITGVDDDLKPIAIDFKTLPQEVFNERNGDWEKRNGT